MKLGTTTWRYRNTAKLTATRDLAQELGITQPVLVEYGPGGAVKSWLKQLPQGKKQDWSLGLRLKRIFLRLGEGMLRKSNLFPLETSEPEEIYHIFEGLKPSGFHVIDRESRVLEAVENLVKAHGWTTPFEYHLIDLNEAAFAGQGDIVIAYNVAQRTKDPEASLRKIAQSTRVGGLLTMGADTAPEGFEKVAHGVFRRVE